MKTRSAVALVLAALVAACADSNTSQNTPHASGEALLVDTSSEFHGTAYLNKTLNCSTCHDINTFCVTCHFNPKSGDVQVPPGSGWVHGMPPPSHAGLESYGDTCNGCHKIMRQYEGVPGACHDCHGGQAPHPTGRPWLDPAQATFHGKSSLDCAACHDEATFCAQCHFGPTGAQTPAGFQGWSHDTALTRHAGENLFTTQQQAVCTRCHGLMNSYSNDPRFTDCTTASCHPGFVSHPADYQTEHRAAAQADLSKCPVCHNTPTIAPNMNGYVTGVACATCHSEALAHPGSDPWYTDHRETGTITPANRTARCALCHKTDAAGASPLAAAPSCFSGDFDTLTCHGNGPGEAPHPLNQAWYIPAAGSPFHGTSTAYTCSSCHAPLDTFCAECHFGASGARVPSGVAWTHGKERHAALNLFTTAQQGVCVRCHGIEKRYTSSPAYDDCSSSTCHPGFSVTPHAATYPGSAHKADAMANLLTCRVCHDPEVGTTNVPRYDGYVTGVSCVTCHGAGVAHPPLSSTSPNWVVDHRTSGNRPAACAICHKTDAAGTGPMPTAPSCYSASFGSPATSCHAGGPAGGHAAGYASPSVHGPAAKFAVTASSGLTYCQGCHATPSSSAAGSNPRFNVAKSTQPSGCETCHNNLTAHPSAASGGRESVHWYGATYHHDDAQSKDVTCALCHGATLAGGVGPACNSCHTAGSPLTALNCTSCHGSPPNGAVGASAPNRAGAHSAHNVLAGVTGVCNTCHNGAGNHTALHYNQVFDVSVLSTYAAKTGTPSYTASTNSCTNVSCHGGQTTPSWLTGTIDVNAACTSCHAYGTTQYNSFYSGEHNRHVNKKGYACTRCHNTATLGPIHFNGLGTPGMVGASTTIGGGSTSVTSYSGGSCTPNCHSSETW